MRILKKYYFVLAFGWFVIFTTTTTSQAQQSIVYTGKAVYDCMFETHWQAVLYYNNTDKFFWDKPKLTAIDSVINGNLNSIESHTADTLGEYIWAIASTKKLYYRTSVLSKNVLIEEALPSFKWTISPNKKIKVIGNMSCQMATTQFRGRDYELWFCPQILVSQGPWKFNNLPGLAVSIKSTDGDVSFLLQENKIMKGKKTIKYIHFKNEIITRDEEKKRIQTDKDLAMKMAKDASVNGFIFSFEIEEQKTIEKE